LLSNADVSNASQQSPIKLHIHLVHEAAQLDDVAPALASLVKFLQTNVNARIIIYASQPLVDYAPVLSLTKSLRENLNLPKEVGIRLVAPFGEYRETEMEAFFNLGVRLKYASGWVNGGSKDQIAAVDAGVLRKLSEFGFRVPIEWYVHENSMQLFEAQIQNLLITNFSAGFSLPLVSQNPYYRFEPDFPNLPEAVAYCQFLARNYKEYPHFDDVFYPLNILALLIKQGGWSSILNLPSVLNFSLDERGQISVFRQSPTLGHRWASISEVLATSLEELRDQYLQFASVAWKWREIPYCEPCCWRHVCGGLDPKSHNGLSRDKLDTMCGYRKLFLEHFANLRVPDYLVGVSEKK